MDGCARSVDKLGIGLVQTDHLYALYTGPAYTDLVFVRRPYTALRALSTACPCRFLQKLSVRFSCTHYTQGLLMQINKESY